MDLLKAVLQKYVWALGALVAPLGVFALPLTAMASSAFVGLPFDPMFAAYTYANPGMFWAFIPLSAAGSAVGSLFVYFVGRKGEELLLEKRVPAARREQFRRWFERHEFLAVMVPAILPPPMPFKLVILTAGGLKVRVRRLLGAIFLGRLLRYSILTLLVLAFGQTIVENTRYFITRHLVVAPIVAGMAAAVGLIVWRLRRGAAKAALSHRHSAFSRSGEPKG